MAATVRERRLIVPLRAAILKTGLKRVAIKLHLYILRVGHHLPLHFLLLVSFFGLQLADDLVILLFGGVSPLRWDLRRQAALDVLAGLVLLDLHQLILYLSLPLLRAPLLRLLRQMLLFW